MDNLIQMFANSLVSGLGWGLGNGAANAILGAFGSA